MTIHFTLTDDSLQMCRISYNCDWKCLNRHDRRASVNYTQTVATEGEWRVTKPYKIHYRIISW